MSNFGDLKLKINEWSADDEDILLRKLKDFTDNYVQKSQELGSNLENINKYVSLVNVDYFNSLNTLKNVSIKKFVEHIVDSEPSSRNLREETKTPQHQSRVNTLILSKEEREANLLSKFKSAIAKSLENLNIKSMLDIRIEEKESIIDDDNVSVSSSRYFANNVNKGYKNMKLPFIIGTGEFFRHEYLGVYQGDSLVTDNNGNNGNYERRPTTLEINEEFNVNNRIVENHSGNEQLYKNSGNIPSIPGIPGAPVVMSVPGAKSIPPVPKVIIPIPPALNLARKNLNESTGTNIPKTSTGAHIQQKIVGEDIGNVYASSNSAMKTSNNLNQIDSGNKERIEVSFKDTLNKMFNTSNPSGVTNNNTKSEIEKNPNNSNMNTLPLTNTQYHPINNQEKSEIKTLAPNNKLDGIIRRPTIFDNMEDDDDDNTGLFKKGIDKRLITRPSIFESVISKNNFEKIQNDQVEEANNTMASVPAIKDRDTLQSFNRESAQSAYTQQNNTFNMKNTNTQGASTNMAVESKNKNLESKNRNLIFNT